MRIFAGVLCLAVMACTENSAAIEAVRLQLADPNSAEFDDVATKDGTTCGFVNAKNRVGGYVGYRAFIVENGAARIEANLGEFAASFPSECPRQTALKYIDLLTGQTGGYEAILTESRERLEATQ